MFQTESLEGYWLSYIWLSHLFLLMAFWKSPAMNSTSLCTNEAASANDPGANHSRLGTVWPSGALQLCTSAGRAWYLWSAWQVSVHVLQMTYWVSPHGVWWGWQWTHIIAKVHTAFGTSLSHEWLVQLLKVRVGNTRFGSGRERRAFFHCGRESQESHGKSQLGPLLSHVIIV